MDNYKKISLKLYRHKEEKDVYLTRNWGLCGGGPDTNFYEVTTDVIEAVRNTNREGRGGEKFEHWMKSFDGKLYATFKKKLPVEIDGYTGTLEKEVKLYVCDFEKVVLTEV